MHRLAVGHALFCLVRPADPSHYMEDPEEPGPARVVYRVVSVALLCPEYALDRRSPGTLVPRHRASLAQRRLPLARIGSADLARAIATTGAARRRVFRTCLLLSPLHDRLLCSREAAGSRRGPCATAGGFRDTRTVARPSALDHETGWKEHAVRRRWRRAGICSATRGGGGLSPRR